MFSFLLCVYGFSCLVLFCFCFALCFLCFDVSLLLLCYGDELCCFPVSVSCYCFVCVIVLFFRGSKLERVKEVVEGSGVDDSLNF